MRDFAKAVLSMMWSGWVYGAKGAATTLYPDDQLAATFDALFYAGDNMQRGAIDLIAGLLVPNDGAGTRDSVGDDSSPEEVA